MKLNEAKVGNLINLSVTVFVSVTQKFGIVFFFFGSREAQTGPFVCCLSGCVCVRVGVASCVFLMQISHTRLRSGFSFTRTCSRPPLLDKKPLVRRRCQPTRPPAPFSRHNAPPSAVSVVSADDSSLPRFCIKTNDQMLGLKKEKKMRREKTQSSHMVVILDITFQLF